LKEIDIFEKLRVPRDQVIGCGDASPSLRMSC
jgi:hypothetical protein